MISNYKAGCLRWYLCSYHHTRPRQMCCNYNTPLHVSSKKSSLRWTPLVWARNIPGDRVNIRFVGAQGPCVISSSTTKILNYVKFVCSCLLCGRQPVTFRCRWRMNDDIQTVIIYMIYDYASVSTMLSALFCLFSCISMHGNYQPCLFLANESRIMRLV